MVSIEPVTNQTHEYSSLLAKNSGDKFFVIQGATAIFVTHSKDAVNLVRFHVPTHLFKHSSCVFDMKVIKRFYEIKINWYITSMYAKK